MTKVLCFALVCALAACKGGSNSSSNKAGPGSSPSTDKPAAAAAAKGPVNACTLITPDEVSQIAGIPLKAEMGETDCSLEPKDEVANPKNVHITLDIKDSDLIPTLRDMGKKDGHEVAGLGEGAFIHGTTLMQLGVLSKGETLMIVMMVTSDEGVPGLEDKAKAIAQKMLSRR